MGLFGVVGPEFGLRDVKVALWEGDGTYGTAVDIPSVQMYEIQLQTTNAQLEGDDKITDTNAIARSAQIRVRFGSVSLEALSVLLNINLVDSTDTHTLRVGNLEFPYFGICGQAYATRGGGDTHVFVPQCKIMEGFTISMQYGQYSIPEVTCMAVFDDTYQTIFDIVKHETATAVTLPPNYAA